MNREIRVLYIYVWHEERENRIKAIVIAFYILLLLRYDCKWKYKHGKFEKKNCNFRFPTFNREEQQIPTIAFEIHGLYGSSLYIRESQRFIRWWWNPVLMSVLYDEFNIMFAILFFARSSKFLELFRARSNLHFRRNVKFHFKYMYYTYIELCWNFLLVHKKIFMYISFKAYIICIYTLHALNCISRRWNFIWNKVRGTYRKLPIGRV